MKATSGFTIAFDGPAVAENRLEVMDFAPSMFAFGSLIERINEISNGTKSGVSVYARLGSERGSFALLLELRDPEKHSTEGGVDAEGLVELALGDGIRIGLIKYLICRACEVVDAGGTSEPDAAVVLRVEQDVHVSVLHRVVELANDAEVCAAAIQAVAPLRREGITGLYMARGMNRAVAPLVLESDLPAFDAPKLGSESTHGQEGVSEFRTIAQVETPKVDANRECSFSAGRLRFKATIRDQAFLRALASGTPLTLGESLEVCVRQITKRIGGREVAQHEVTKVLRRLPLEPRPAGNPPPRPHCA